MNLSIRGLFVSLPAIAGISLVLLCSGSRAEDFTDFCLCRTAVERVYHAHRLGQKLPFEQASPLGLIERMVREELHKEAVLKRVYGIEISPAQLDAEVRRIDTTTRAPEMLAEIKTALGNDPEKISQVFAKPFLVERFLRERFENDEALHAPQRRIAETARGHVQKLDIGFPLRLDALKECKEGEVREALTWELGPRPATEAPVAPAMVAEATETTASGGVYSIEATAKVAQVLASPEKSREEMDRKLYFEDLPAKLQDLFRAQLHQPGDVSAVIETPAAFQIYLTKERSPSQLSAAVLTVRKRSYEDWLAEQPDP